jgi:hypothetical protein
MAQKTVRIKQGTEQMLVRLITPGDKINLEHNEMIKIIQNILKEWMFSVNRGREALTIILQNREDIENSTIFDILKVIYENNKYLGTSLYEYAVKNYQVGLNVMYQGEEIEEYTNTAMDFSINNKDNAGITKIWFDKPENKYIMLLKTDAGVEVISTLSLDFEDLDSPYNTAMHMLELVIQYAMESTIDISDPKLQMSWKKAYASIVNKPYMKLVENK